MKKHGFSFTGIPGIIFLIAGGVLLYSCSPKAQSASPSEMANAFAEARVPLLKQRVSSRDFSLPLLLLSQGTVEPSAGARQGSAQRPAGSPPEEIQSLSDLKGKVVFLNFWATWCGPCRLEMPSMQAVYNKYREKGLEMLAVNCMEKQADILDFMENNNLSFPVVLDGDGGVSGAYGIQAIPTTFLIDREGNIVLRMVGSIDWDTPKFHTALELLLNS